jgi:glycosyltransferase involved in cell wall biosynthesis
MYEADLLGGLAGRVARIPVIWSIRFSTLDPSMLPPTMARARAWGPLASHLLPKAIISCGHVAQAVHQASGYTPKGWTVIHNGIDLDGLRFDPAARTALRQHLGLSDSTPLVGMVARFDPQKDHSTLLDAMRALPDIPLILAGRDTDSQAMHDLVDTYGLGHRTHLLGNHLPVQTLFSALDIHVLASRFGEGFPNVVAESLACGCISLSTDSGDARWITDPHHIVPMQNPQALATLLVETVESLAAMTPHERDAQRALARTRAEAFPMGRMIDQFSAVWKKAAGARWPTKPQTPISPP